MKTLEQPLYLKIAQELKNQINRKIWTEKIPGLRELSIQYGANMKTVNKAVSCLVRDGILYRAQGLGTFVSQKESGEQKKTYRSGFILSDIRNPNFAQLVQAMQEIVHKNGSSILINTTSRNPDSLAQILGAYQASDVDIVFIQGGAVLSNREKALIHGCNLPLIGSHASGGKIDNVQPDMVNGANIVTRHLLELFGPPIGYISGSNQAVENTGRFKGYCEIHLANHFTIDFSYIHETQPTYKGGYDTMKSIIATGKMPRSLLVYNEQMTMGVVNALNEHSIRVPEDIGLACFDDSIPPENMLTPLTTVSYSNVEMAERMYELALRRLTYPQSTIKEIQVPMRIKPRLSTIGK